MNWQLADQIAGTLQNLAATVAISVSTVWGYFRFIRFRTLKPRLEFAFDWNGAENRETKALGILTIKLSNRGATKVNLRKAHKHRCFLKYALLKAERTDEELSILSLPSERLEELAKVFVAHKWIEPGETIDDVKALYLQAPNALAVQFEVVLFGAQKWSAVAAFPLRSPSYSMSQDEQDTYEESEACLTALRTSLNQAKRALMSRADDRRPRLEFMIESGESLLTRIGSGHPSKQLINEAERVSNDLDEELKDRPEARPAPPTLQSPSRGGAA